MNFIQPKLKNKKVKSVEDTKFYKQNKDKIESELKAQSEIVKKIEKHEAAKKLKKFKEKNDNEFSPMNEKDKIIEIFFGIQKGELPEKYLPLKEKYLKDKESLGGNCSSCQLNGLMSQYKNKIIAGKLD